MNIEALDVVRWSLYALTVGLGVALTVWLVRDRNLRRQELRRTITARLIESRRTLAAARQATPPPALAEALAGIRLPVHWAPSPSPEVVSPVVLTTESDTPEDVARVLSDELVRLGYRVRPIAVNAARALKGSHYLTVRVDTVPTGVTATITLMDQIVG